MELRKRKPSFLTTTVWIAFSPWKSALFPSAQSAFKTVAMQP
jgi:hypothetical protein